MRDLSHLWILNCQYVGASYQCSSLIASPRKMTEETMDSCSRVPSECKCSWTGRAIASATPSCRSYWCEPTSSDSYWCGPTTSYLFCFCEEMGILCFVRLRFPWHIHWKLINLVIQNVHIRDFLPFSNLSNLDLVLVCLSSQLAPRWRPWCEDMS